MSRQHVYDLVAKYKEFGELAYKAFVAGRSKITVNPQFVKRIIEIRKENDYGSEKINFVMMQEEFPVSQHVIQIILALDYKTLEQAYPENL